MISATKARLQTDRHPSLFLEKFISNEIDGASLKGLSSIKISSSVLSNHYKIDITDIKIFAETVLKNNGYKITYIPSRHTELIFTVEW